MRHITHENLDNVLTVQPGEVVIGKLIAFNEAGQPLVDYPANPTHQPLPALTTVSLATNQLEQEVALLFAEGDMTRPVIIGLIRADLSVTADASPIEARVDGQRVVLSAQKEIVLKCGKASITLTRAGKVLIRGAYLLSRSSGVNRIKGGSVQMN
ncbi:MAG: DUF2345 domain-containing protein [Thioploca sp.]|nr:DUF2345 domain-containing protein [Thioploca sp.]